MTAISRSLWYWAWLVRMTVPKRQSRGAAQVWKNLVLVQARNAEEAIAKAEMLGRSAEGDAGGGLLIDGRPARSVFVGVADAGLVDSTLSDGVEVMFQFERARPTKARSLARARPALLARLRQEATALRASQALAERFPHPRENEPSRRRAARA
ncbi:MAG: DUF4288 domain-containing protein [Gemmatimonadales bacterium]